MSSIQRPLSGDVLVFSLAEERERAGDATILERSGRNARTLLKEGPLRATVVVLDAGGVLAEHQAEGPIMVQPLEGRIRFTTSECEHEIGPGELLSAGGGVRHSVSSEGGATFLLTVAHPTVPAGGRAD